MCDSVAQPGEHHLDRVGVAGSNPVGVTIHKANNGAVSKLRETAPFCSVKELKELEKTTKDFTAPEGAFILKAAPF